MKSSKETLLVFIRSLKFTGLALLFCSFIVVSPLTSAVQASNGDAAITLDFKDIELSDLIQTISALTGKNFVYDDSIRGKATIISSEKMTKNEAYKLFLTVMSIKGFTVVPTGKTHKIVATKLARQSNLPTQTTASNQDQFVTRMITLKHINAVDIASTILAPLMPKTSNIVVYQPSNMLIISDNASNIQRLATIIKELDVARDLQETRIVSLQYADAKETAKVCNDLLATTPAKAASRTSKNVSTSTTTKASKVLAYERTNSLIIMATADDIAILEGVIAKLDLQPAKEHSSINLYYLENADAETLSKTLNEILTGIKQPKKRTTTATTSGTAIVAAALRTNVSVTADKPTNALIVNATPEDYVVLKDIIRQLDIRRKQVYVEALIMELSMDATEALGVSLQGAFGVGDSGAVGISTLGGGASGISQDLLAQSVNGILAGGFSKLIDVTDANGETISIPAFSALIDLSETDTDVNILSAPRLLTSDNEEAEIVVGRNVPIITSRLTDSTGSDSLAQSVSVERKDVALTLRFTPQITQGNLVRLNVYQETTDLVEDGTSVGDVNDVGPTFTTRKISNTVLAQDGQTVVLGGLISTNKTDTVKKVPFLGDIPILGWLFKSTSHDEVKTNLLVFITPTIIKDMDDLSAITLSNRQQMDTLQEEQAQEQN
jgi:general secretion pathway protein D